MWSSLTSCHVLFRVLAVLSFPPPHSLTDALLCSMQVSSTTNCVQGNQSKWLKNSSSIEKPEFCTTFDDGEEEQDPWTVNRCFPRWSDAMTSLIISLLLTLCVHWPGTATSLSILHTEPTKAMNLYRILFPSRLINGPNLWPGSYVLCRNHLYPSILHGTTTAHDHYYPHEGVQELSMWRHGYAVHS